MAGESVVDGSEKRADYHEGNASIIKAPEEEVEALGMAGKEVRQGAADQTAHSPP